MQEPAAMGSRPLLVRGVVLGSGLLALVLTLALGVVLMEAAGLDAFTPAGARAAAILRGLAGAEALPLAFIRLPLTILLFLAGTATGLGDPRGRLMFQAWAWLNLGVFTFGLLFAISFLRSDWLIAIASLAILLVHEHPAMIRDHELLTRLERSRPRRPTEPFEQSDEYQEDDPW